MDSSGDQIGPNGIRYNNITAFVGKFAILSHYDRTKRQVIRINKADANL